MSASIIEEFNIPFTAAGVRLDQFAADRFPDYSRARIQAWVKSGELLLDGKRVKPNYKLRGGEFLALRATIEAEGEWEPEDIPVDIVYEDDSILIINKPDDLVVHPAAGNYSGTLLNALLFHDESLLTVPRAGIVHRLDKDTTGLMVVAKTIAAQTSLVQQMQARSVSREYLALVYGVVRESGVIDAPIGRDPKHRKKMAVVREESGKEAVTHYRVEQRFEHFSKLRLQLETGRTHQIRVHMTSVNHSLIGDQTYIARRGVRVSGINAECWNVVNNFPRQALHATQLSLEHPESGEWMTWNAEPPEDFQNLLRVLETLDKRNE